MFLDIPQSTYEFVSLLQFIYYIEVLFIDGMLSLYSSLSCLLTNGEMK